MAETSTPPGAAEDPVYDALVREGIEQASPTVCKAMARFCLRLSQVIDTSDEYRVRLITEANRWHDAAITKIEAARGAKPECPTNPTQDMT